MVFNNGSLGFVELEMKANGIVTYGTELDNPHFDELARATGLHAVRVEHPDQLEAALSSAFAHDGPSLIDVPTSRHELALPPGVTAGQAKGFALWATRSVLSGNGDELLEVAATNLRQLVGE